MQTCREIAAKRITGGQPWSQDRENSEDADCGQADTGPGISRES
jgi:hypothetical protein